MSSMFQVWFNFLCARAAFLHFILPTWVVQYWMRRLAIIHLTEPQLGSMLQSKSCTTCHWKPLNAIAYAFFHERVSLQCLWPWLPGMYDRTPQMPFAVCQDLKKDTSNLERVFAERTMGTWPQLLFWHELQKNNSSCTIQRIWRS